ncbi:MAG: ABC transporter ATP-binding protein [Clostridia bacterium]|nr:ABC transporter ATP-binding protein [Clostridia bacterium]
MDIYIRLDNITKTYRTGNNQTTALNGISMTVNRGEMVAVMGASGSGKTTLMNIIGLLDDATTGTYLLNGTDICSLKDKSKAELRNASFGFVVQDFALVDQYTVKQNVELPFTYSKLRRSRDEKDAQIHKVLKMLGIENKEKERAVNLSGGQRQRVAIARAIICNPDIILADEPTGALDSVTSSEIMSVLAKIHGTGKTILVVTHDSKVAQCCQRVITISDGKII